ncbi:hypothetical protein SCMU_36380 [Sinomonas cyclohexanicum]|uniref:Uncharacterized protein n=1 Tax=Sinomonas cyclohexanicum TaxID=322009 RepID=A0ABM7PZR0_SINCY|nr:hypothetical protein SCMU_36380 [Corynebacterium cyclohexanicum]
MLGDRGEHVVPREVHPLDGQAELGGDEVRGGRLVAAAHAVFVAQAEEGRRVGVDARELQDAGDEGPAGSLTAHGIVSQYISRSHSVMAPQ